MEAIQGKFLQRFWRFSVGGKNFVGFRTESLTDASNVDEIRKELKEKFPAENGYSVIETQWDVIIQEEKK